MRPSLLSDNEWTSIKDVPYDKKGAKRNCAKKVRQKAKKECERDLLDDREDRRREELERYLDLKYDL